MSRRLRPLLAAALLVLGACAHVSRQESRQAADYAVAARSDQIA